MRKQEYQGKHQAKTPVKTKGRRVTTKFLAFLLALGLGGYAGYNIVDANKENKNSQAIVTQFNQYNNELVNDYAFYTESIAEAMYNLIGMDANPLQVFTLYNILQHNGYLSINKEFSTTEPIMFEAPGQMGISVALGSGRAANVACNLNAVMKAYGFDSSVQIGYVYDGIKKVYNSPVVSVEYCGVVYLLDPYGQQVYLKDSTIAYRSVQNPNLRFIPSELMDKRYGAKLNAESIGPIMNWASEDYGKYSAAVRTYTDIKGPRHVTVTRSQVENEYNTNIYPNVRRLADNVANNYFVDCNTVNAYVAGYGHWPTSYCVQNSDGLVSPVSYIDESEYAKIK